MADGCARENSLAVYHRPVTVLAVYERERASDTGPSKTAGSATAANQNHQTALAHLAAEFRAS